MLPEGCDLPFNNGESVGRQHYTRGPLFQFAANPNALLRAVGIMRHSSALAHFSRSKTQNRIPKSSLNVAPWRTRLHAASLQGLVGPGTTTGGGHCPLACRDAGDPPGRRVRSNTEVYRDEHYGLGNYLSHRVGP